ncbi:hypothetical protein CDAR_287051 [Caerostris darwini]|uniref:Uncharacterized protein n=1 Tax=Caerostris darwini TaxID=1538125 RepID=A0AAV4RET5_9ARAC|nr:hypothetical protein CDAR_287051 [Caerostris darwini]
MSKTLPKVNAIVLLLLPCPSFGLFMTYMNVTRGPQFQSSEKACVRCRRRKNRAQPKSPPERASHPTRENRPLSAGGLTRGPPRNNFSASRPTARAGISGVTWCHVSGAASFHHNHTCAPRAAPPWAAALGALSLAWLCLGSLLEEREGFELKGESDLQGVEK